MKRYTIAIVALLFAAAVGYCGGRSESGSTPGSAPATEAKGPYSLPLSTSGATLTIATSDIDSPGVSLVKGVPVFNAIAKLTGVKIKWELATGSDYDTMMQTRIAAGAALPDIIKLPSGNPLDYAHNGVIIPLKNLIQEYAPNITKWFAQEPNFKKLITAPDGDIYFLPEQLNQGKGSPNGMWTFNIRTDWLQKLGLKEPTTLEEMHHVLMAFKTEDPNGNGQQDEIPYSPQIRGAAVGNMFGTAFGLHLVASQNQGFWPDASGKIIYEWIDPRAKDFLATVHQFYEEGLIDPQFENLPGADWTAEIINNKVGLIASRPWAPHNNWDGRLAQTTGNPQSKFFPILPISGPGGKPYYERDGATATFPPEYAITKDAKDPILALRWMDFALYSPQGVRFNEYGIEGVSYTMVNGAPQYTDKFLHSPDGINYALRNLGAVHYNILPVVWTEKGNADRSVALPQSLRDRISAILDGHTVAPMAWMLPTDTESTDLTHLMADINTFRDETVINFITGKESLNQFDAYVKTMKSMGIDQVLQIKQAQYNRYLQQ